MKNTIEKSDDENVTENTLQCIDTVSYTHLGGNYDNLSDTEILRAQSGICLADALCGYAIALCQLVQGFTRLDGMEHLLFRSDVLLWNLQCFTGFNFLVAAGVDVYKRQG